MNPNETAPFEEFPGPAWLKTMLNWLEQRLRPLLGWSALIFTLGLTWIPGEAANANEWLTLTKSGPTVEPLGPLAVILVWILMGWQRGRRIGLRRRVSLLYILWHGLLFVGLGFIIITQALIGWLPGIGRLWQTARLGAWASLLTQMQVDLNGLFLRFNQWLSGVSAGGAIHDDIIFAGLAGVVLWSVGWLTGWLVRRTQRGLLSSLPALWLLAAVLLYGTAGRWPLLMGLLCAISLHLVLNQRQLEANWITSGIDFNPSLFMDRALHVAAISVIVIGLAGILPSISIRPLWQRYNRVIAPIDQQVEQFGQRLFPDLQATSRFHGRSIGTGLPNSFLLGAGPELSQREVLRVRTDEPFGFDPDQFEELPPSGHYMRGGTLTEYNGHGWKNSGITDRDPRTANEPVEPETNIEEAPFGRRIVKHDVFLAFGSNVLYTIAEPLSVSVDFRVEQRAVDDLIALWSGAVNQRVRSYSVVSSVPGVNDTALRAQPAWGVENPLPEEFAVHLELPETITDRTRQLAQELTAGLDGPFAQAQAIELYLRSFEYDLSIDEPPDDVEDVADYFLFDLQRGYCDYYATAFIVLARLNGLPARFATGFAVGRWNVAESMYIVTEAEAHSWPEVYFPDYGWIPFEPTAGRPALARIGVSGPLDLQPITAQNPPSLPEVVGSTEPIWNWQMLFWLFPLGLLLWGVYLLLQRWQIRPADPWASLLRWGQRIGRPLNPGETVLEYGSGLAAYTLADQTAQQDIKRHVAREVRALSNDVSTIQYGAENQRLEAETRSLERWQTLRGYLRTVKIKKPDD